MLFRSCSRISSLPSIAAVLGVLAFGAISVAPAMAQNEFCAITGVTTSCKPVQWCGPGPSELYSYSWSGPNGFVFEGPCFDATVTGTYTLTITRNSDGRVETCSKDFLFTPGDVPCSITGPSEICRDQSAELCGPEGTLEYSWEGPGGFTSASRCIIVSVGGTYTLHTRSTSSRCEAVCTHELSVEPCKPPESRCWLTAGGAKFEGEDGSGPIHSWGGNVNPGCSPTAGEGGQWTHVQHDLRLQFQGRAIQVIRCGNVVGIDPGSTSPVTPFNFIEFKGTGRLHGIQGNKFNLGNVFFFARAEDRGEPGSNGEPDPIHKDRYFLHVFSDESDPLGSTLFVVDVDGDPSTVDPLTLTDGNMQLHISGCDKPRNQIPSTTATPVTGGEIDLAATDIELYRAYPSPFSGTSGVKMAYALPASGGLVELGVYDLAGRMINKLATGFQSGGRHEVSWNGSDLGGSRVKEGVYFIGGRVNGEKITSRVIMVR